MEKSFTVLSHADNKQTDLNLPTVKPFRLKGKTHGYVVGIILLLKEYDVRLAIRR